MSRIAAVVLAAGRSSRMGGANKLLAELDGIPLLHRALAAAWGSSAADIVVVTGHQAEAVRAAVLGFFEAVGAPFTVETDAGGELTVRFGDGLSGRRLPGGGGAPYSIEGSGSSGNEPALRSVRIVHNASFADGMATSLKKGIEAVSADAEAAIVLLGDMPGVTSRLVDALASAFAAAPHAAAVVPLVDGRRGNPVLLARKLFAAIADLSGDEGARRLLSARNDVLELAVEDEGAALDIDTPDALARARSGS